jgi:chaperonin GroES
MILVQPMSLEQKTSGGLYIPDNARTKTQIGKVLRTGPGRVLESGKRVEPEVKAGDVCIYLENNIGQRLTQHALEGEPILLPEIEVVAVIEGYET